MRGFMHTKSPDASVGSLLIAFADEDSYRVGAKHAAVAAIPPHPQALPLTKASSVVTGSALRLRL